MISEVVVVRTSQAIKPEAWVVDTGTDNKTSELAENPDPAMVSTDPPARLPLAGVTPVTVIETWRSEEDWMVLDPDTTMRTR